MQYTKQQIKATLFKMYKEDVKQLTPQQIATKYFETLLTESTDYE